MIKIIKQGKITISTQRIYKAICEVCDTHFEFEDSDIQGYLQRNIKCPLCNNTIFEIKNDKWQRIIIITETKENDKNN